MSNGKIKVILCEPGEVARVQEIENTLEVMQDTVEGYIETLTLEDAVIVCNEEGLIHKKRLNRCIVTAGGQFEQFIMGTFIICGICEDEFCSLDEDQIRKYMKLYGEPVFGKKYIQCGGKEE